MLALAGLTLVAADNSPPRLAIPQPASPNDAETKDGQWLELEGIATFVSEQPGGLELELSMGTSRTRVRVEGGTSLLAQGLLNKRIRVIGVCQAGWSLSGRRVTGCLIVPCREYLTVVEAAPEIGAGPLRTTTGHGNELPLLTTAGQVKRLKREEALRGYPVRIQGVITCVQPEFQGIVIQDATLGVYVKYSTPEQFEPPRVGDYCEITGITDAGFAPMVRPREVTTLGDGILPDPVHPTWDQIMNGSLDTQYAELEGIITEAGLHAVTLLTREGEINVGLPGLPPGTVKRYENALVRMRGCLFARHEDENVDLQVKLGEVELHNALVSVQEPPPIEPFAVPLKRVGELLFFDSKAGPFQRVKVSGQIVSERQREYFLMDGTNGLRFWARQPLAVQIGDLVEVAGFPRLGGPSPELREGTVRVTGRRSLPAPKALLPEDWMHAEYDSTLVRVEGLLVSRRVSRAEQLLEIQAGVRAFVARVKADARGTVSIPLASRLALTGVYAGQGVSGSASRNINGFELLVNSPSDIRVLARPAWWTLGRLLAMLGALSGVLVVALVWITLLRRKVEQRTAQLEREIRERERAEHHHTLGEERSRIARDLHDHLGSSLTEISMLAETGRDQPPDSENPQKRFDRILRRAHELVRALDEIVWAIDPRKDTLPALLRYLAGFAEEYASAAGLACRVEMPPSVPEMPLPARVRHEVFLGVKEALNNAVRHAQATQVLFRIGLQRNDLNITIADNGRGFDSTLPGEGDGLPNLRQRLNAVRGRCEINSEPGEGTTVILGLSLETGSISI